MPRPKRWFRVSHDINRDPDVIELKERFGLSGFSLWLEILSILDQRENVLRVSEYWMKSACKLVGCRLETGWKTFSWIVSKGWLEVKQTIPNGLETLYRSPNYLKFHKTEEPKGTPKVPPTRLDLTRHDLTNQQHQNVVTANAAEAKRSGSKYSPRLVDAQFVEDLAAEDAYADLDIRKELGKCRAWMKAKGLRGEPTKQRFVNWLNRAYGPKSSQEPSKFQSYQERIDEENIARAERYAQRRKEAEESHARS